MAYPRELMQIRSQQLCGIRDTAGLSSLLQVGEALLYRLRFEKPYHIFERKKKSGKLRLIEAPQKEFKALLRKFNDYLQCCYFFSRTNAAYGFIQQPRHIKRKRNILTNARLHNGKKFMLNLDLQDFFHQVSKGRVVTVFRSAPFGYSAELAAFVAELTTYQNRLPMGSPTSPALSNFCCIEMDHELEFLAKEQKLTFSRYVDDLTFSANEPIEERHYQGISSILQKHSFRINPAKIAWMGENDEKMVTGLVLRDRPHVPAAFLRELEKNLGRLRHILEFSAVSVSGVSQEWIDNFRQHLLGKIRFLQMVYGQYSPVYKKMSALYQQAFDTRSFVESFNWNDFPYF